MPTIDVTVRKTNVEVSGSGRVLSVAGKTGVVTLGLSDIIGLEQAFDDIPLTSPAGADRSIQINNSGSFGAVSGVMVDAFGVLAAPSVSTGGYLKADESVRVNNGVFMDFAGQVRVSSGGSFNFTNGNSGSSTDTSITRVSAGVVGMPGLQLGADLTLGNSSASAGILFDGPSNHRAAIHGPDELAFQTGANIYIDAYGVGRIATLAPDTWSIAGELKMGRGSWDSGIARLGAASLKITDGSTGLGSLTLNNLNAQGYNNNIAELTVGYQFHHPYLQLRDGGIWVQAPLKGDVTFQSNNTYDIGASGAMPRDGNFGRDVNVGGTTTTNGCAVNYFGIYAGTSHARASLSSWVGDNKMLIDGYNAGSIMVQLGGTTSAFPSIARNDAGIDFKLADGSALTNIAAGDASFVNGTAEFISGGGQGGVLRLKGASTGALSGSFYYDGPDPSNAAYAAFGVVSSGSFFGSTGKVLLSSSKNGTGTQLPIGIGGYSGGWTEWMTLLTNGNVGIGTTTPGAKLDVTGLVMGNQVASTFGVYPGGMSSALLYSSSSTSVACYTPTLSGYANFTALSVFADKDMECINSAFGMILKDRTTATRYRAFVDNGVLSIEAA